MALTCESLLSQYPQVWRQATVHPFLDQCKAGTIRPEQFDTWLVQDYLFVTEFTRMLARALAAAPGHHFEGLLSGLHALQDELNWFREKAIARSLSLAVPRQTTCQIYCDFMGNLVNAPYTVQATALWAIECAYNQGWQQPGPMPEPYAEFAHRWGNPAFTDYVVLLSQQADEMLAAASPAVQTQAESAFLRVATLEQAFWQMAYETSG